MEIAIAALIGYSIGSIPWALIIGSVFYKTDIRKHGSGNLGGTNAGRVLGKKVGVSVSVLDALKSVLATAIVYFIFPQQIAVAGFMAAIGHCFPLFANFKGGKAVASIMGFLLSMGLFQLMPIWIFIIALGSFFAILYLTKYVSLSSMLSIAIALIATTFFEIDSMYRVYLGLLLALTIWRHKENIRRILKKEERKITWM